MLHTLYEGKENFEISTYWLTASCATFELLTHSFLNIWPDWVLLTGYSSQILLLTILSYKYIAPPVGLEPTPMALDTIFLQFWRLMCYHYTIEVDEVNIRFKLMSLDYKTRIIITILINQQVTTNKQMVQGVELNHQHSITASYGYEPYMLPLHYPTLNIIQRYVLSFNLPNIFS